MILQIDPFRPPKAPQLWRGPSRRRTPTRGASARPRPPDAAKVGAHPPASTRAGCRLPLWPIILALPFLLWLLLWKARIPVPTELVWWVVEHKG